MDRAAIQELFTFTDYSWGEHEDLIRPLGDAKLTEPAPGSGWPALRDALAHINWGYVRWLANPAGTTDEPEEGVTPREMNVDGDTIVYSPADIFAHTLLHERQHHSDVHTLLYQLGIEVPIVEYRFSLPERLA
jgi:uncharacterized damage-inducible protein DinB